MLFFLKKKENIDAKLSSVVFLQFALFVSVVAQSDWFFMGPQSPSGTPAYSITAT